MVSATGFMGSIFTLADANFAASLFATTQRSQKHRKTLDRVRDRIATVRGCIRYPAVGTLDHALAGGAVVLLTTSDGEKLRVIWAA